ncbi:hypothetical protein N7522_010598 [Penicillium canescens]|uniref:uncharacterized protein n=1 Tax=Penicillium canescens TaxID=5083 RepID=UPI0026E1081B|nr:uncharacterized protein N7446_006194 [Penicillium canescens]KAJ5990391.1 hypothetical protein N7522_010598 [Penicillium canescens]KAJ6062074.1 hypothetical protein N7446_006194 [Penicillium canescens]KAJ6065325.1 hypothetical protein N7444_000978 [Penicillium canescens]
MLRALEHFINASGCSRWWSSFAVIELPEDLPSSGISPQSQPGMGFGPASGSCDESSCSQSHQEGQLVHGRPYTSTLHLTLRLRHSRQASQVACRSEHRHYLHLGAFASTVVRFCLSGSSYDRTRKHRDREGDGEGGISETVGSRRRWALPPHKYPYPGVGFVIPDLEDCDRYADGGENWILGGDEVVGGNEQKVAVNVSSVVTVPAPVHAYGVGLDQDGVSEVRRLGDIIKTVVFEMKSEER